MANAAQICTYYLPGVTAGIGGGPTLVNGNSRGAFVPESMSMSNWGVNMRGTARVRYIYLSLQANTPTLVAPTPLPSMTPTATMVPQTYHVSCGLIQPDGTVFQARVRNFPSGWITPEGNTQIDGREEMRLNPGTLVTVYEMLPGTDGIMWARISADYESYFGSTLWVRMFGQNNSTPTLLPGLPTACGTAGPGTPVPTPFTTSVTALPPPAPSFPEIPLNAACIPGRDCPHTDPGRTSEEIIRFVLACEAGSSPLLNSNTPALLAARADALGIAHVIYNRTRTLMYSGTALQVVSQGKQGANGTWFGQFECFAEGSVTSLGLGGSSLGDVDPFIVQYALALAQGNEPTPQPFNPRIDYIGLYTLGVFGSQSSLDQTPYPTALAGLMIPACGSTTTNAYGLHIAIAPFGPRANATVFFHSYTGCGN
ncbi:MAG: hypothetical protein SF123_26120 [Chloroflexota bacterium]|nr:hypothetical protein [Chloroflexota bacterium]